MFGNFFRLFRAAVTIGRTKMVIIVRTDLNMTHGKVASQCAHAAVTLYDAANRSGNVVLKSWLLSGQPKIVLRGSNEKELRRLYDVAKGKKLNACLIFDAGRTQIDSGTLTVVGIGPNKVEDVDEITKDLRLL